MTHEPNPDVEPEGGPEADDTLPPAESFVPHPEPEGYEPVAWAEEWDG